MKIRTLEIFKSVAEKGSFTEASKAMHCSQSTVSFQMKLLEEQLGFKLFEKVGRNVHLTGNAVRCLPELEKILRSLKVLQSMNRESEDVEENLDIVIPESLLISKYHDLIQKFHSVAPRVNLNISIMDCYRLCEKISKGNVDLAISYNIGNFPDSVKVTPLDLTPVVLVGANSLSIPQDIFKLSHVCANTSVLTNNHESGTNKFFLQYLKKNKIQCLSRIKLSSQLSVNKSLIDGMGVAYLPHCTVEKEIEKGLIREYETNLGSMNLGIVLITRKNYSETRASALFLELLREKHSGQIPWDTEKFIKGTCLFHRSN